ncbi:MAG: zinc dependent phospholipase C family protein [Myxococcota bacterium]
MPAFFLHVTAMELVAKRPGLPERFRAAFEREPGAMRLGSIFVDLPYLENFPLQLARHYTGAVTFAQPWGQIFHTRATGSLGLALIEALRREHGLGREGSDRAIAFIGGFLSHHAFDRTIHPLVRAHVERDLATRGGHPNRWHQHCEKWQSLFFHRDHAGRDCMGTRHFDERARTFPGARLLSPSLPDDLFETIESASLTVHARAPGRRQIGSWLRWARVYARLTATPLGRREGIAKDGSPIEQRVYYDEPDFPAHFERAITATLDALAAAADALETSDIDAAARAAFLHRVPNVDISVGF